MASFGGMAQVVVRDECIAYILLSTRQGGFFMYISKKVLLFLLDQIDQQIVVIDNGNPAEVMEASDNISTLLALMREAIG
jgi:hypothetical protein